MHAEAQLRLMNVPVERETRAFSTPKEIYTRNSNEFVSNSCHGSIQKWHWMTQNRNSKFFLAFSRFLCLCFSLVVVMNTKRRMLICGFYREPSLTWQIERTNQGTIESYFTVNQMPFICRAWKWFAWSDCSYLWWPISMHISDQIRFAPDRKGLSHKHSLTQLCQRTESFSVNIK